MAQIVRRFVYVMSQRSENAVDILCSEFQGIPMPSIAIATYPSHEAAEAAVKQLTQDGIDMQHLSIVGKGYHTEDDVVGYYTTGDRMKSWGGAGAFWGGLWGLLVGAAFFIIPGIGPVVIAGPLISALVGALEGAVVVGGLSALGAALVSIGIPKDSVLKYETALKADKYLLVYHGSREDVEGVQARIEMHGGQDAVESYSSDDGTAKAS